MLKSRVKELARKKGVSLRKIESDLGFGTGYLSKLDASTPNGTKLHKLADYLGVSVEYLVTGKDDDELYYYDKDARDLAQFLFENPDYKILFDASRKVKKEDLLLVKELIDRFS